MKRIAVIIILVVGLFCGCEYVDDIPGFPGTENSPPTAFIDEISPSEAMEGAKHDTLRSEGYASPAD